VRVTRADTTVQELRHALLARDSLIGYARPAATGDSVRVALALADVRKVEARGRSAGVAVGVFVGVLLALGVAAQAAAGAEGW
jgi:hypothetical protein